MGQGKQSDISNILKIEHLSTFNSSNIKEKGIKGRVTFASRRSCFVSSSNFDWEIQNVGWQEA